MPNFTDLTGLASVASALAVSLLWLPWTKRLANRRRAWATGAVFVAALIPFNGLPLAAYVRGATGDLSITTLVLLWCALLRPWTLYCSFPLPWGRLGWGLARRENCVSTPSLVLTLQGGGDIEPNGLPGFKHRLALLALIALAAVTLYPLALGFGAFDPYRLGYGNWLFVAMLMLAALAAWFWKNYLIVLCIALATLAWATGWYESGNLWDYLLDPFVSIYALAAIMSHAVKTLVKPQRDRPAP